MRLAHTTSRMTRQNRLQVAAQLRAARRLQGCTVPLDVQDQQGEVGHVNVFVEGRKWFCQRGTPDPRNLFRLLKRAIRVRELTLVLSDN